jgi:predicted PurR-regulated permease PerM
MHESTIEGSRLPGPLHEPPQSGRTRGPAPETPQLRRPAPSTTSDLTAVAIIGLFVIAAVFTLHFARALFIPVTAALLLGYVLRPVVRLLGKAGLPNLAGTIIVFALFTGSVGAGLYFLSVPAAQWVRSLPEDVQQAERKLRTVLQSVGAVREAVDDMANASSSPGTTQGAEVVTVAREPLSDRIIQGAQSFAVGAAASLMILFFLLAAGDRFLRRTVTLLPSVEQQKRLVRISRGIEHDVSRYLLTTTLVNLGLGIAVGFVLFALGMPNPMLWGAVVALLNYVPYLGAIAGVFLLGLVALVSFESTGRALLVPLSYILLNGIEAHIITPHIHGRRFSLHPLFVFGAVGFFAWLWNIPGALMAVPLLTSISIVCSNINRLRPIAILLSA